MERILDEAENKALSLCPFFTFEDVKQVILDLPEFIRVDNVHFTPFCVSQYKDGVKVQLPVNIRHIPLRKEMATVQDIIHNDPGNYQWN